MSRPLRGALLVEGEGELTAAPRLLNSLWSHLGLEPKIVWERPLTHETELKNPEFLAKTLDAYYRDLRSYAALIVMYDADFKVEDRKACPKVDGPAAAAILRAANLPIPAAVILPCPEYEHWIIANLPLLQGREVIDSRTKSRITRIAEDCSDAVAKIGRRGGKELLADYLDGGSYKPVTMQTALTAMLDFDHLQKPEIGGFVQPEQSPIVPAFGTLCRACQQLHANLGKAGFVYPSE